jgi:hypothetical protein
MSRYCKSGQHCSAENLFHGTSRNQHAKYKAQRHGHAASAARLVLHESGRAYAPRPLAAMKKK